MRRHESAVRAGRSSNDGRWRVRFLQVAKVVAVAETAALAAPLAVKLRQLAGAICARAVHMETSTPALDDLTELIIGCAMTVHTTLGPGLLESVYRDCLVIELKMRGITVEVEVRVPILYRGHRIRNDLKIDLRVDGRVVVETKAAERVSGISCVGHSMRSSYAPQAERPA